MLENLSLSEIVETEIVYDMESLVGCSRLSPGHALGASATER